jgi:hypothetical protein
LSQILLIAGKNDEYVQLATGSLAPLLVKAHRVAPEAKPPASAQDFSRLLPDLAGALALLPLSSQGFLAELSRERVQSSVDRAIALQSDAKDDHARLAIDLVLEACYRRLGQEPKRREAAERIERNPARAGMGLAATAPADHGSGDDLIEGLRALLDNRQ